MALPEVDDDCPIDSRLKAMSRADWKRSSGFFSRQCRMMRSRSGGRSRRARVKPRRIRLEDRAHRLDRRVRLERLPPGEHLVEDDAEREDVGAMIDRLRADLLGRHVGRRAEHHAGLGLVRVAGRELAVSSAAIGARHLGQAEVEDLHAAFAGEEDVLRLEVAVDDALVVRGREPARDLDRVVDRLARRHRRPVDSRAERFALEQLGDDYGAPSWRADVVDREDVGMVEHPGGARFLLEAAEPSASSANEAGRTLTATSRASRVSFAR